MKRVSALLLGLLLTGVFTLPAWPAGILTTNKFLYKPSPGARGDTEKRTFDAGLDRIDARLGKEIWVGDPNYGASLQDAITAIGTANKTTLRIPAGAWTLTSSLIVPANITLKFEEGAYLDLSALPDMAIEGLSSAAACVITWNNHGLQTGDYVRPYGIRQLYLSGATHIGEWMNLNDNVYPITKIDNNSFSIAVNTSAYHAYVPATDPGRICVPLIIKGKIEAGKQKIFNVVGAGQICRGTSATDLVNAPQTDFYPEWFGAVGNGVTDDLLALNACLKSMVIGSYVRGTMHLSTWYAVSDTFSINELNLNNSTAHIIGSGRKNSGFVGLIGCASKPIMEIVGSGWIRLKNFGFTGVNANPGTMPADAPSVALLLGRSNFNTNGGGSFFEDLGFWGWYEYGLIFNYGYATSTFRDIESYGYSMSNANNHWMFNLYMGSGSVTNPFPALVPTNSAFMSYTGSNASADGNRLSNIYFGRYMPAAALSGSAGVYLNAALEPIIDYVAPGGTSDYMFYAKDTKLNLKTGGGDGYGNIAGIYVCSTVPGNQTITVDNFVNAKSGSVTLMTDANTCLNNSKVSRLAGSGGYSILLDGSSSGAGSAQYCEFDCLNTTLTSFVTNGAIFGCNISIPGTCTNLSIPPGGYQNNIKRLAANGRMTWIDGDVWFGQPGGTVPDVYYGPYKMVWAAAAPTTGSWAQGSVIHKIGVAASASPGWICNLDNTFGTLNGGTTTGSITSGTKLLTVNSVTGLTIGNFIDVVADGGGNAVTAGRIVNIDSSNKIVTLSANATANATGTAVSFHNHTTAEAFSPMAPTGARTSGVTAAATSPITVTHGLGTTPTKVLLTSVDGVPTGIFPNTLGTTTFAINFAGGGSHAFYWEAIQ